MLHAVPATTSVDVPDADGRTPLHFAAAVSATASAERLLDHGADASCKARDGETPLSIAAKRSSKSLLEVLSRPRQENQIAPNPNDANAPDPDAPPRQ